MSMLVMDVGIVRMGVGQECMRVRVRMRLATVPDEIVRVLVMLVVDVPMHMPDGRMRMRVLMPLLQM